MKLQNLFDKYNQKYFKGALADYKVIQSDRYGGLGMCRRKQREIHIQAGLAGRKLRETLLHEMAHANSNGQHGKSWLAEMYRLARAGAPTKKDADGYVGGQTINPPDMICMFEDYGLEAGVEGEWKNVRRA